MLVDKELVLGEIEAAFRLEEEIALEDLSSVSYYHGEKGELLYVVYVNPVEEEETPTPEGFPNQRRQLSPEKRTRCWWWDTVKKPKLEIAEDFTEELEEKVGFSSFVRNPFADNPLPDKFSDEEITDFDIWRYVGDDKPRDLFGEKLEVGNLLTHHWEDGEVIHYSQYESEGGISSGKSYYKVGKAEDGELYLLPCNEDKEVRDPVENIEGFKLDNAPGRMPIEEMEMQVSGYPKKIWIKE